MNVERIKRCLIIVVIALLCTAPIRAQQKQCQNDKPGFYIDKAAKKSNLGIDYGSVTRFKLGSRKTIYRIGEMISVDLAMLNIADAPIFFRSNIGSLNATLKVQDEKGKEVRLVASRVFQSGGSSFSALDPGEITTGSVLILSNCSERSLYDKTMKTLFDGLVDKGSAANGKVLFDHNLFVNQGDSCLSNIGAGRYTITAEVNNDYVAISPDEPSMKTAVGTIRSTPLTITIIE